MENLHNRVRWMDYKGTKILVIDFSGLKTGAEVKQVTDISEKIHSAQPLRSVRRLTIARNVFFIEDARKVIAEYTPKILKYTIASASIGFTDRKTIIMKTINANMKDFETEEDAAEWLSQQE